MRQAARNPNQGVYVIFDIDGTLADSLPVVLELVNELKVTNRVITREDYERIKNMTAKAILREFNVPLWRLPGLLVKGRAALTQRMAEVPLFSGMKAVLEELAAQKDFHLYVMSSNSLENVTHFLRNQHIENTFNQIHGGVGFFGKAAMLRKIIKANQLPRESTYYVGDEARDVEAAKKAGIHSVAVTWGYNGDIILRAGSPDYVAESPADLPAIFKRVTA